MPKPKSPPASPKSPPAEGPVRDPCLVDLAVLIVTQSAIPLPRIAPALGFDCVEDFSSWYEDQTGRRPEAERSATPAEAERSSSTLNLPRLRRALVADLGNREAIEVIRDLSRGRK